MWEGYKPNAKERRAIEDAYIYLYTYHIQDGTLDRLMKEERRGYGNKHDAISTIAAKALCVKWFLEGIKKPDALLRDWYRCRPATVWLMGKGADRSQGAAINMDALEKAVEAHKAAFDRMVDKREQK